MTKIPFNKPYLTGYESRYIEKALENGYLSGNNQFTHKCSKWIETTLGTPKALLTPSCTAALEMCAILADIREGDEIIMPSFTFVSTANAFVLRGGIPVFVDIDPLSLNIAPDKARRAITERTKAIVVVHYAGHSCDMSEFQSICSDNNILLIEDAAQAILSRDCEGRYLGTVGDLGCLSFHETKNIICGEGGALLVNNQSLIERAQIIQEKGTDRCRFLSGFTDKYTWRDIGSSFYPNEITSAFLYAQLQMSDVITQKRRELWAAYHKELSSISTSKFRLSIIDYSTEDNNSHIYYIVAKDLNVRSEIISLLRERSIMSVFHYIPLHSSPGGKKYGRSFGELEVTDFIAERLLRLPLWIGVDTSEVIKAIAEIS